MPEMTIRQLEYFVAAVDAGTFSAAALRLGVTQSAVSLATGELERALGVQLFVRRKATGPILTPAGQELLVDARRLVSGARELQANARSGGVEVAGSIRLGCFPTISPYVLGSVLQGLPRRYPKLEVSFVEDSVEGLQQRLRAVSCDLAVLYDIGIADDLHTTTLYQCRPYAVLPRRHRLARGAKVRMADLIDEPMIIIDMPPSLDFFLGLLARAGLTPTIRYTGRSVETVRALVGRGLGWSLLLHRPVPQRSYDGSAVVARDLADIDEVVDVLAVRSAEIRPARRIEAFIDYCLEVLPAAGRTGT